MQYKTHDYSKRNLKQRSRAISHEKVSLPTCRDFGVKSVPLTCHRCARFRQKHYLCNKLILTDY